VSQRVVVTRAEHELDQLDRSEEIRVVSAIDVEKRVVAPSL